ncbi:hypothetical protein GS982_31565 [Rhodococcus hoagii]|nr:hypothetical protein [Prescottella equi]
MPALSVTVATGIPDAANSSEAVRCSADMVTTWSTEDRIFMLAKYRRPAVTGTRPIAEEPM